MIENHATSGFSGGPNRLRLRIHHDTGNLTSMSRFALARQEAFMLDTARPGIWRPDTDQVPSFMPRAGEQALGTVSRRTAKAEGVPFQACIALGSR